jgi:hypothetical protein
MFMLHRSISVVMVAGCLLVGSCQAVDDFTGGDTEGRTLTGTAVGTAAGALIGATTGAGLLESTAVGAAVGTASGYLYDRFKQSQSK